MPISDKSLKSVGLATAFFGFCSNSFSQTVSNFTLDRYSEVGSNFFETFYVESSISLKDALDDGLVLDETLLLVTETSTGKLALVRDQMAFHHIAQGSTGGKNWMATF